MKYCRKICVEASSALPPTPQAVAACTACTYGQLWCTTLVIQPWIALLWRELCQKVAVSPTSPGRWMQWSLVPSPWCQPDLGYSCALLSTLPQISALGLASGLPLTMDLCHKLSLVLTASPALCSRCPAALLALLLPAVLPLLASPPCRAAHSCCSLAVCLQGLLSPFSSLKAKKASGCTSRKYQNMKLDDLKPLNSIP